VENACEFKNVIHCTLFVQFKLSLLFMHLQQDPKLLNKLIHRLSG